jgi:hypothetical protein
VNLRRWDIVYVQAEDKTINVDHPCVVLSHEDLLESPKVLRINVLMGTKKPPAGESGVNHVLLDESDGLDFPTLIDCSFVLVARKAAITRAAGNVTVFRRQEIQRKTRAFLGLG